MNLQLILRLVGLRYKLLWAQTRTRNGRIALFLTGYLLALLILILMTAGGLGSALVAVRSGKAERVAQAVLGGLFVNALFTSVITGFGINTAFTDAALRRFAISARERLAAQHLTGILEPVWIFVLGLWLGLAAGLFVFGTGNPLLGALAALLLLIVNYLVARVMATLIEWLAHVRGGTAILFAMLLAVCLLPGLVIPRLAHAHGFQNAVAGGLRYSPPFAAAAVMVTADSARLFSNLGLLAAWIAVLLVALVAVARQAVRPRSAAAAEVTWDSSYERVASIFGPAMAPLIGRTLRYYVRSNKVRFNFIVAIPVMALVTFTNVEGGPQHYFVRALGAFAVCGFLGTAVMCTNQFGFDSSGFRRYFLMPVPPAAILRASSYTALSLGATLTTAALLLWVLFAPLPFDARMVLMLLFTGVGGLFLFNALAIWTSLLAPRATSFESTFGNQLSLSANVLLIGGILACIFGAITLDGALGPAAIMSYWWIPVMAAAVAIVLYGYSLQRGAAVFVSHRERLLNTLEGRS